MASAETCVETIAQRNCCGCSRAVKTFNTFHMQTGATVVQHCTALVALPWLNVGEVHNCSKALLHHHPQVSEETTVNNLPAQSFQLRKCQIMRQFMTNHNNPNLGFIIPLLQLLTQEQRLETEGGKTWTLTSLAHGKGGQARQEINWFET